MIVTLNLYFTLPCIWSLLIKIRVIHRKNLINIFFSNDNNNEEHMKNDIVIVTSDIYMCVTYLNKNKH